MLECALVTLWQWAESGVPVLPMSRRFVEGDDNVAVVFNELPNWKTRKIDF